MTIPVIDERIAHKGVSYLRTLTNQSLRELKELVVIQDTKMDEPLAVIVPYPMYLEMQEEVTRGREVISSHFPDTKLFSADPHTHTQLASADPLETNSGIDANPDTEHSLESWREGEDYRAEPSARLDAAYDRIVDNQKPVEESDPQLAAGFVPRPNPSIAPWGVDGFGSPKHGMLPLAPHPEPSAPVEGQAQCRHCEGFYPVKEGAAITMLCPPCFVAGHRNVGMCMKCAELAELRRRAEADSTGADRTDIDYSETQER